MSAAQLTQKYDKGSPASSPSYMKNRKKGYNFKSSCHFGPLKPINLLYFYIKGQ